MTKSIREIKKQNLQAQLTGDILGLLGGALTAIGVLLPWASAGFISVNGFKKIGSEAWIFVILGLLSLIIALNGIITKKSYRSAYLLSGLLCGAYLTYAYTLLSEQLSTIRIGAPSIGSGFWACVIGAVVLLLAGLAGSQKKLPKSVEADEEIEPGDVKARLAKLDGLKESGAISEGEYSEQRQKILDSV